MQCVADLELKIRLNFSGHLRPKLASLRDNDVTVVPLRRAEMS
jgi:hypothetical protein